LHDETKLVNSFVKQTLPYQKCDKEERSI